METSLETQTATERSRSSLALMILIWIMWISIFMSWPLDLFVTMMKDSGFDMKMSSRRDTLFPALAFVGFVNLALSFAARWFFFGFLIQEKRIKPGTVKACVAGVIGAMVVFLLTKAVETYGLVLFLRRDASSLLEQLIFWVPSLIVFIIHLPNWMIPKRISRA